MREIPTQGGCAKGEDKWFNVSEVDDVVAIDVAIGCVLTEAMVPTRSERDEAGVRSRDVADATAVVAPRHHRAICPQAEIERGRAVPSPPLGVALAYFGDDLSPSRR